MTVEASTITFGVSATAGWTGDLTGEGTVRAADATLPLSIPVELGGLGAGQTPESLLASAVASCYAVTLGLVLEARGLAVLSLAVDADVQVARTGRRVAITGIMLRPRVVLANGAEVPSELFERAERACPVSQAVRAGIPLTVVPGPA